MWHASAALLPWVAGRPDETFLRGRAREALSGVGDASLGEWESWSGFAYHVKRRLSVEEQKLVGEAVDIRGTMEAVRRHEKVKRYLPPDVRDRIE